MPDPASKLWFLVGEAHYVQTMQQYDDSFNKFFTRLAKDGITRRTPSSSLLRKRVTRCFAGQPPPTLDATV